MNKTQTYVFYNSTAGIVLILSLYMDRWNMPVPLWTPKKKCHIIRFPLHQVFSVMYCIHLLQSEVFEMKFLLITISILFQMLIGAIVGWTTCVILTNMGVFSDDPNSPEFFARTDSRNDVIHKTPWFVFPYPGTILLCSLYFYSNVNSQPKVVIFYKKISLRLKKIICFLHFIIMQYLY